jgi:hypothetical protein
MEAFGLLPTLEQRTMSKEGTPFGQKKKLKKSKVSNILFVIQGIGQMEGVLGLGPFVGSKGMPPAAQEAAFCWFTESWEMGQSSARVFTIPHNSTVQMQRPKMGFWSSGKSESFGGWNPPMGLYPGMWATRQVSTDDLICFDLEMHWPNPKSSVGKAKAARVVRMVTSKTVMRFLTMVLLKWLLIPEKGLVFIRQEKYHTFSRAWEESRFWPVLTRQMYFWRNMVWYSSS